MTYTPQNAVLWAEIPTADIEKSMDFYSRVFGYDLKIDETEPHPMSNFPTADQTGCAGHIYPGKPAGDGRGPTVHMAVPGKLEDSMDAWQKAGGAVLSPAIAIPPGRFAYATDLDGNSIGLFEPAQR